MQIKFILFCHLQDFWGNFGENTLDGPTLKNDIRKRACHFL